MDIIFFLAKIIYQGVCMNILILISFVLNFGILFPGGRHSKATLSNDNIKWVEGVNSDGTPYKIGIAKENDQKSDQTKQKSDKSKKKKEERDIIEDEFISRMRESYPEMDNNKVQDLYRRITKSLDKKIPLLQGLRTDEHKAQVTRDLQKYIPKMIGLMVASNKADVERLAQAIERTVTPDTKVLTSEEKSQCLEKLKEIMDSTVLSQAEFNALAEQLNRYFMLKRNKSEKTIGTRLSEIEQRRSTINEEAQNIGLEAIRKIALSRDRSNTPKTSPVPSRTPSILPGHNDKSKSEIITQST